MTDEVITVEDRLLKPAEVAAMFNVDIKTVSRWALNGRLKYVTTPGGHRRYREIDVLPFTYVRKGRIGPKGKRPNMTKKVAE